MAKDDKMTERFGKLMKAFGEAVGNVWDDPEFKSKAREFAQTAVDAAARAVEAKVKEEEMRKKIRTVGKAAQDLGKSLEENFKPEKVA
jgi:hypothetical protein